jgi:hypothetical protein
MTPEIRSYFVSLCARADNDAAIVVPLVRVRDGDWEPKSKCCHHNARHWESREPGRKAVCGWLICGTDLAGGYTFGAHSVVEENGELYDITPHDCASANPEPPRLFLRHEGEKRVFDAMLPEYNSVSFNPYA